MKFRKLTQNPSTKEVVAHHEAGHAVLYFLFGHEVKSLTIDNINVGNGIVDCPINLPTGYLPYMAKKEVKELFEYDSGIVKVSLEKDLKKYAMICISGYAAEYKYLNKKMPYGICCDECPENDFSKVRNEIKKANKVLAERKYNQFHIDIWDMAVRSELNKPAVWESVKDIASAVLETTSGVIYTDTIETILSKRLTPYLANIFSNKEF